MGFLSTKLMIFSKIIEYTTLFLGLLCCLWLLNSGINLQQFFVVFLFSIFGVLNGSSSTIYNVDKYLKDKEK